MGVTPEEQEVYNNDIAFFSKDIPLWKHEKQTNSNLFKQDMIPFTIRKLLDNNYNNDLLYIFKIADKNMRG